MFVMYVFLIIIDFDESDCRIIQEFCVYERAGESSGDVKVHEKVWRQHITGNSDHTSQLCYV